VAFLAEGSFVFRIWRLDPTPSVQISQQLHGGRAQAIKPPAAPADISHMIISDDQARQVAASVREGTTNQEDPANRDVPPEILEAARNAVASAPETRPERIEHARAWLDSGDLDSRLIAEKMMCRIMSDWLR
jgi:hypothetical protein